MKEMYNVFKLELERSFLIPKLHISRWIKDVRAFLMCTGSSMTIGAILEEFGSDVAT